MKNTLRTVLSLALLVSCTEVETVDPVPVTVVRFDPAPVSPDNETPIFPAVPTPSNMLLNPATGQVQLPLQIPLTVLGQDEPLLVKAFASETAEELVETYLNTLYGYTVDGALDTSFAGRAIDPETVNGKTIFVLDITPVDGQGGEQTPVSDLVLTLGERDDAGVTSLNIALPPGGKYEQGHTYAAVITNGVHDTLGEPVVSSYVFNLLKSPVPLATPEGKSTCALPDATAVELEFLRSAMYEPLFNGLDAVLSRGEVAQAWVYTIRPGSIALNDPLASIFPTPNDLVMTSAAGSKHDCDEDGKKDCVNKQLCFPIDCANDPPVQQAFFEYMNGLDGWPASMAIVAGFSLPLEASSVVPEAFGLFRTDGEEPTSVAIAVSLDEAGTTVTIKPEEMLQAGASYGAYIKTDLVTQGGIFEVRPSTITAITRLLSPAFESGKSLLTDFAVGDNQSVLLEVMRLGIDQLIKKLGLDSSRNRIASIWSFAIQSNNEALYDPTAGIIPYPNDLLMTLDNKGNPEQVNIPLDENWPIAQYFAVMSLNSLDGFSTVAGTSTTFLQALDPASFHFVNALTDLVGTGLGETYSLAVADVTDVDPTAGIEGLGPLLDDANILGDGEIIAKYEFGNLVLKAAPGNPLRAGRRYMVVAFDNLKSQAVDAEEVPLPVEVAPVFFLTRSPDPLVNDEGQSNVSILDDASAGLLEQLRQQYDPIFTALESDIVGVPRERVVMFWTFTTQTIGTWLHKLKKKLVTLSIGPGTSPGTVVDGEVEGLENVYKAVLDGSFAGYVALAKLDPEDDTPDPIYMSFDDEGTPDWQPENLPLVILVPKAHGDIQPPFPVVILQHGMYGNKKEVFSQADAFLEAGYAVVSMDLPLHGDRTIEGQENGTGFFTADPVATRDHIVESAFNIVQLISYIGRGNSGFKLWFTQASGEPGLLDTEDLYFVGSSLGAMAGTLALAVTDEVDGAALVAPAGNLTRIIVETTDKSFQDPINEALEALGLAPGTPEYKQFIDTAQALLDRADPVNYARHLAQERLFESDALPLFILTAGKDELMPKATSKEVICAARSENYPLWKEYKDMCHTFFFHGCNGEELDPGGEQAAEDIISFFANTGEASAIEGLKTPADFNCQEL
jgi:alpha-beta hydrolase superfamily lysophospholipase